MPAQRRDTPVHTAVQIARVHGVQMRISKQVYCEGGSSQAGRWRAPGWPLFHSPTVGIASLQAWAELKCGIMTRVLFAGMLSMQSGRPIRKGQLVRELLENDVHPKPVL